MKILFKALLILIIWPCLIHAEQRVMTQSALKALGAPNHPKVEIAWNRYYDSKEIAQIGQRLAAAHPSLVRQGSIGKSVQGRELYVLTVSNFNKGDPDHKPAMYIDGNIHSNEIQGAEVALYTAWYLAENFGTVDWITELLDHKTFYIVPSINPDARDYYIHEANTPHSPRSGLLPRDDDGDGLFDEDGPDDLNGDGHIVTMRRKSPYGRWKADAQDPRLMIRANPDEPGEYEILGQEGFDNDGDGLVNEDGPGFYDPNRNWGWNWQPNYVQNGADQYPFSIPENRAVADFVVCHENIAGAQSYHNAGGMILRGPGSADDTPNYPRQDIQVYDVIGQLGAEILPRYKYIVIHKEMYTVFGGEIDWFYLGRGIFTFSNELWASFDYFRRDPKEDDDWFGSQKVTYRFDKLLLFEEGIVPWQKVTHPQYGEIEIGGVKKAWTRTAPSFLLEEMCHRNMAFTLFHGYHLPQLAIDSVMIKNLPGGLLQIDAIVHNSRVIPTRSAHDVKYNITRPDIISLSGKNMRVISGFMVEQPLRDIAREIKHHPESLKIDVIPGMGTVQVRWIVAGKPPFQIRLDSKKGGQVIREVL